MMKINRVIRPTAEEKAAAPKPASVQFAEDPKLASLNAKARATRARAHQIHVSLIDMGYDNVGTDEAPIQQHGDTAIEILESDGTKHLIVCGVAGGPTQVVAWIDPAKPMTIRAVDVPDPEDGSEPAVEIPDDNAQAPAKADTSKSKNKPAPASDDTE